MSSQINKNRQILLASRPSGEPSEGNFKLTDNEIPKPGSGQMLLRTIYLSRDPYMRGRMDAGPSYAPRVEIGEVMVGRSVCEVGFIVTDYLSQYQDFVREMTIWLREGRIKYREDITDGLENAPRELIRPLKGGNFGKKIIRVGPTPTSLP
jgi:NADPH-dependent curcumin reductase CurA